MKVTRLASMTRVVILAAKSRSPVVRDLKTGALLFKLQAAANSAPAGANCLTSHESRVFYCSTTPNLFVFDASRNADPLVSVLNGPSPSGQSLRFKPSSRRLPTDFNTIAQVFLGQELLRNFFYHFSPELGRCVLTHHDGRRLLYMVCRNRTLVYDEKRQDWADWCIDMVSAGKKVGGILSAVITEKKVFSGPFKFLFVFVFFFFTFTGPYMVNNYVILINFKIVLHYYQYLI